MKKGGVAWEFWKKEAEAANKSMLSNTEKFRKLIRIEVDFKPPGRARPYKYPILITQTKTFTADRINQVANGDVHDQAVIQRK